MRLKQINFLSMACLSLLLCSFAQAGTWGLMNFSSGKWGATPDVYTITFVKAGDNSGELVVSFSLQGNVNPAAETNATSFSVTCNNITVTSNGSPVTLSGLTNGSSYSCTVVATNSFGSSSASTGVIGTPNSKLYSSSALKIIMMMGPQNQN